MDLNEGSDSKLRRSLVAFVLFFCRIGLILSGLCDNRQKRFVFGFVVHLSLPTSLSVEK